jgi:hypothetical protein
MTNLDLRTGLADIASDARSVDLYDRALSRSRQIRRRRHAGAAVAAVVVLAITGLAWQLLPSAGTGPVDPAESVTPTPSPPTPIEPGTEGEFYNSTLPVPSWPALRHDIGGACPSGLITFRQQKYGSGAITVTVFGSTRVSVPGEVHYIARLSCRGTGLGGADLIVAYRVEESRYVLVDVITDSTHTPAEAEWVELDGWSIDPAPSPDEVGSATFFLTAALIEADPSADQNGRLEQNRTFAWNGSAYVQTGGPTSFLVDPATVDLSLAGGDMVFGPPAGGCRTGTMSLTVTNNGSAPVSDVGLNLVLRGLPEQGQTGCPAVLANQTDRGTNVSIGLVEAGEVRTEIITVVVNDAGTVKRFDGPRFAFIRVGSGPPDAEEQWTGVKVPFNVVY